MTQVDAPELFELADPQDTIEQRFRKFNRENPEIYWAIRAKALQMHRAGATRLSMKGIYESLRGSFDHLNNSYTSLYVDLLLAEYPHLEPYFERRNRAERPMRRVYVR